MNFDASSSSNEYGTEFNDTDIEYFNVNELRGSLEINGNQEEVSLRDVNNLKEGDFNLFKKPGPSNKPETSTELKETNQGSKEEHENDERNNTPKAVNADQNEADDEDSDTEDSKKPQKRSHKKKNSSKSDSDEAGPSKRRKTCGNKEKKSESQKAGPSKNKSNGTPKKDSVDTTKNSSSKNSSDVENPELQKSSKKKKSERTSKKESGGNTKKTVAKNSSDSENEGSPKRDSDVAEKKDSSKETKRPSGRGSSESDNKDSSESDPDLKEINKKFKELPEYRSVNDLISGKAYKCTSVQIVKTKNGDRVRIKIMHDAFKDGWAYCHLPEKSLDDVQPKLENYQKKGTSKRGLYFVYLGTVLKIRKNWIIRQRKRRNSLSESQRAIIREKDKLYKRLRREKK